MSCDARQAIHRRRGETLKVDLFVRNVQTDATLSLASIVVDIECVNLRTGKPQPIEHTPKADGSGYRITADTSNWDVGTYALSVWITEADSTRRVSKSINVQVT